MSDQRKRFIAACGVASLLASISFTHAQTTVPVGLDALSDQRLMTDLANRGLTSLLDRAFEVNHIPAAERDGLKTLIALKQLSDPKARLTTAQRQVAVQKIAAGIQQALPSLTDPQTMMQQATTLL